MKGYSMHEEHRANPENTRRKTKKKQKRKPIHRLITKRKRANERRERITSRMCASIMPFFLFFLPHRCFRSLAWRLPTQVHFLLDETTDFKMYETIKAEVRH